MLNTKMQIPKKFILIVIPLIVLIIIYMWFSTGKIISNNSEEILNINKVDKYAEYYSTAWYPGGTGAKAPFHIARYPTFKVLAILDTLHIPPFLIQAIFLGALMLTGMITMYLFIRKGVGLKAQVSLVGSLFYLLNIYSLTQVWKRFLYQGIFAWAYLPLFTLLWIKWIDKGKFLWLFLFLISSFIFSYTFTQPAHLFTIWTPAGIFILVRTWQLRASKKKVLGLIAKAFLGLIAWIVINLWWFYPTFTMGSTWSGEYTAGWKTAFDSADAVSKSFPIWEVVLLRQSWYLGEANDWSYFYHNPPIILISLMVLLLVVLGIVKSRGNKFRNYLLTLGFVGLSVSKGTNFPLGYTFFHFLFSTLPATSALRNPYEKFGIVWLFVYSIFFSIGLAAFTSSLKKFKNFSLVAILFLSCFVLVYPMWSGDIFPPKHRLDIPKDYIEADNFLKAEPEGRVFHIPFVLEIEKSSFTWGYVGDDPSESLFDLEPVTKPKVPVFKDTYELLPKVLTDQQFPKILGMLGVTHVILHKDSIYPKIDFEKTKAYIEKWQGIEGKKEFGGLTVYSLSKNLIKPRIYSASRVVQVENIEEALKKILDGKLTIEDSVFVIKDDPTSISPISEARLQIPKLTFKKISNVHYIVDATDAKGPFILVFNNTFDKLWQAKIGGEIIESHFTANGFANGWIVDKKGDYEIDIKLVVWPWD